MEQFTDNQEEEDDVTEEASELPFTFPLVPVKPLYSRFRRSEDSKSARKTQLKPYKPISVEEDSVDGGYYSENVKNSICFEENNPHISGDFFHVGSNSGDILTTIRNVHVDRKFPLHENNRGKSESCTPLPSKLRTPFSAKSSILVRRVPKLPLTPSFKIIEKHSILSKNSNEAKHLEPDVDPVSVDKKSGIANNNHENKQARILKDILNQNNPIKKVSESDKLFANAITPVSDPRGAHIKSNYPGDENLNNVKKSPKSKSGVELVTGKGKNTETVDHPSVASQKHKVQKSLFNLKEEGNRVFFNLRFGSGLESNILCVNNIQYSVLSKLGQGGSSQVYLVLDKKSTLLAIKCVNLVDADEVTASGYLKEIEILANLQKSNRVIKLIDHEYDTQQQMLYVVMEKGDTDLSTLLKQISNTGDVSLPMIIYYWTEMLQAVKEIHTYGIVHADLKPANFLLVCGRLKLIDFGIASAMQNDATSVYKSSMHGTCNYMSPEAIQDPGDSSRTKVGYKSDVWSLGCILYNLLYRKTPFQHIVNNMKKLQVIASRDHRIDFPPLNKCPPPLMEAMKQCLNYDAKKRPSVVELLATNYIWSTN